MRQTISHSKLSTLPNFNDGLLSIYKTMNDETSDYPKDYYTLEIENVGFEELSISDRRRYEYDERNIKVVKRIRTHKMSELDSLKVIKIQDDYYYVYNIYDFIDRDGFIKVDVSLIKIVSDLDVR